MLHEDSDQHARLIKYETLWCRKKENEEKNWECRQNLTMKGCTDRWLLWISRYFWQNGMTV